MSGRCFVVIPHAGVWAVAYIVPGTAVFSIEATSMSRELADDLCDKLNKAIA